jgi:hypothetical protein
VVLNAVVHGCASARNSDYWDLMTYLKQVGLAK